MPETILTEPTETALWQSLVRDAESRACRQLGDSLESYLVFTLMRHQHDTCLGHKVMAVEWLEAQVQAGRARENGLRDVGDGCLLIAGLYPERAERRVSVGYFQDLGRGAYRHLAEHSQAGLMELYRRLSSAFAELVRVLFEVRRLAAPAAPLDPGLAYAWCESDGGIDQRRAADAFPGAILMPAAATRQ
jgi:hypothetical protein